MRPPAKFERVDRVVLEDWRSDGVPGALSGAVTGRINQSKYCAQREPEKWDFSDA